MLERANELVVIRMSAYPEPGRDASFDQRYCTVVNPDPSRKDRFGRMNAAEVEAWMFVIREPKAIGGLGLLADFGRQGSKAPPEVRGRDRPHFSRSSSGRVFPCACSRRAFEARLARAPWEAANCSRQSFSSSSSASRNAAKASCSAFGSLEASSKASFSRSLITLFYGNPRPGRPRPVKLIEQPGIQGSWIRVDLPLPEMPETQVNRPTGIAASSERRLFPVAPLRMSHPEPDSGQKYIRWTLEERKDGHPAEKPPPSEGAPIYNPSC